MYLNTKDDSRFMCTCNSNMITCVTFYLLICRSREKLLKSFKRKYLNRQDKIDAVTFIDITHNCQFELF